MGDTFAVHSQRRIDLAIRMAVVAILLAWSTGAAATRPRLIRKLRLGKVAGVILSAKVYFDPDNIGPEPAGDLTVTFVARGKHKVYRSIVRRVGAGFLSRTEIRTADVTGRGRRQLLVTTIMGRAASFLWDFDGKRITTLYARDEGRVAVSLRRTGPGSYKIVEDWPRGQFEDEDNLGTGYALRGNVVRRILHWDGHGFVPDLPGPSRIQRLHGK